MIDVWHTLESAFPKIIGYLREAEKDLPEQPVRWLARFNELVAQSKLEIIDNHYQLTHNMLIQGQQIEDETNQIFDDFCNSTYSEEELIELERIIETIKALSSNS